MPISEVAGSAVSQMPDPFGLEAAGPKRFVAGGAGSAQEHAVMFGGRLLAQSIMAASRCSAKAVVGVQTVFARSASAKQPVTLEVQSMHEGRTVASATVTVRQGERLCARSLVLHHQDEDDLIAHQLPMPSGVGSPASAAAYDLAALVAPGSVRRAERRTMRGRGSR